MAETPDISQAVEKAISESLDAHLAELRAVLRAEIVEKVNEAVKPLLEAAIKPAKEEHAPGGGPTDLLNAAVASIYDAPGQGDILKALLDGLAQFTPRAALFVVKGSNIAAWQARGFQKDIKGFSADASAGLAGRAIRDKEPVNAAAGEFDSKFISTHGNPADGNACVLPIVVRDKVAAIVYTDAGTDMDGTSDESAARLLVRSAASWLELLSLRKSAGGSTAAESTEAPAPQAEAAAPVEVAPPPAPEPPKVSSAGPDLSDLSKEDQEVHKKAKRFAKLLVDEIKLYNQAKVAEGRQNKDIYRRLQEDIDKSRSTYEKRYSNTAAGPANYFKSEVIRILADNDASLLGSDFPQ